MSRDIHETPNSFCCPRCKTEMKPGTADIRGEHPAWLMGRSSDHLYFDFEDEGQKMKKKRIIMRFNESCPAYLCPKCHIFVADNGKPRYG